MRHITAKWEKEGDYREQHADIFMPTLTDPDEVWRTYHARGDDKPGDFRTHSIKLYRGGKHGLAVSEVVEMPDGQVLFNFYPAKAKHIEKKRRGVLVYSKDRNEKAGESE